MISKHALGNYRGMDLKEIGLKSLLAAAIVLFLAATIFTFFWRSPDYSALERFKEYQEFIGAVVGVLGAFSASVAVFFISERRNTKKIAIDLAFDALDFRTKIFSDIDFFTPDLRTEGEKYKLALSATVENAGPYDIISKTKRAATHFNPHTQIIIRELTNNLEALIYYLKTFTDNPESAGYGFTYTLSNVYKSTSILIETLADQYADQRTKRYFLRRLEETKVDWG